MGESYLHHLHIIDLLLENDPDCCLIFFLQIFFFFFFLATLDS